MIEMVNGVSGRFKFVKYRGDGCGGIIESSRQDVADWVDNLVLDQGLDGLGRRSITTSMSRFHVGSGNSPPSEGDTGLESLIAVSGVSSVDSGRGAQVLEEPYYLYFWETRRFAEGQAAGNLSEIGAGWGAGANDLFSRALIQDVDGNPITITVLPDEVLDVTYEVRLYPSSEDSVGVVELGGVLYDYTARASNVGSFNQNTGWDFSATSGNAGRLRTSNSVYSGNIGSIFEQPSGQSAGGSSVSSGSYVDGSLEGSSTATFGLTSGNIGGVRSARIGVGWSMWQVEFSSQVDGAAIPKDETKELSLTFTHSWSRRGG